MRSKSKRIWLLAVSLVFTLCFIGVGPVSAKEKKEIRIGAHVSMTGMNAMTGAEQKWTYEQAVADINANGGVFVKDLNKKLPIKLILADDKSVRPWRN